MSPFCVSMMHWFTFLLNANALFSVIHRIWELWDERVWTMWVRVTLSWNNYFFSSVFVFLFYEVLINYANWKAATSFQPTHFWSRASYILPRELTGVILRLMTIGLASELIEGERNRWHSKYTWRLQRHGNYCRAWRKLLGSNSSKFGGVQNSMSTAKKKKKKRLQINQKVQCDMTTLSLLSLARIRDFIVVHYTEKLIPVTGFCREECWDS